MRSLLEHGGKSKKFPGRGLINHHFLMVLVNGGHAHRAGDHHIGLSPGIANLPDALARGEFLEFDLPGQHRSFLCVEQGKKRNLFQHFWIARHWSPHGVKVNRFRFVISISQTGKKEQPGRAADSLKTL